MNMNLKKLNNAKIKLRIILAGQISNSFANDFNNLLKTN